MKVIGLLLLLVAGSALAATELATVNGSAITGDDVVKMLSQYNDVQQKQITKDVDTKTRIVDQLVNEELLYQSALAAKMDKDAGIQKDLEFIRKRILGQ